MDSDYFAFFMLSFILVMIFMIAITILGVS